MSGPPRRRRWWTVAVLGLAIVLCGGVLAFWGDIASTRLDPKVPFQTYRPPPAPDYARPLAWSLWPQGPSRLPADVFFIGPTTYDGGRHWNAPIDNAEANRQFRRVMAPNYVGPFVTVGHVFAPKYRHASLYTKTTLREDAREARQFAYGDVRAAFRAYLAQNRDRPLLIVGVEQGGTLGLRLLAEEVAPDPSLRGRLVAAYLIDAFVPADAAPLPPCVERGQAGCLAAWATVYEDQTERAERLRNRALVWNGRGELENLSPRRALCFNPILGAVSDQSAPARMHLGAANATGLEWGARPAFMTRQVTARCDGGVLHVSRPKSASLRRSGSWADKRKAPGFNLFYADIEADAQARLASYLAR